MAQALVRRKLAVEEIRERRAGVEVLRALTKTMKLPYYDWAEARAFKVGLVS